MIRYRLTCPNDHDFESWFQSAAAFDSLCDAGRVTCPDCGSKNVFKALMAPPLGRAQTVDTQHPLTNSAQTDKAAALADFRRQVENNSEYVGVNFAAEARAIHDGDAPGRSIYGEAKPAEAIRLLQEGVPIAPLPFLPRQKTN